jgi:hypothetical protein
MHNHESPDRAVVRQKRVLCVFVEGAEIIDWESSEPSARISLAVSLACQRAQYTSAIGDLDCNEITVLIALDAYPAHIVVPCVLHEGIEQHLCELPSLLGAFDVLRHGAFDIHVDFNVLNLVFAPAVNVAVGAFAIFTAI